MKTLKRNERIIYYAQFLRNEPIEDSDGYYTSETAPVYSEPIKLSINTSPASGESATRQFGEVLDYDRTLVTCDTDIPITETSVLWIDETDTTKPFDYVVKKIGDGINSKIIAVKKVEVR